MRHHLSAIPAPLRKALYSNNHTPFTKDQNNRKGIRRKCLIIYSATPAKDSTSARGDTTPPMSIIFPRRKGPRVLLTQHYWCCVETRKYEYPSSPINDIHPRNKAIPTTHTHPPQMSVSRRGTSHLMPMVRPQDQFFTSYS